MRQTAALSQYLQIAVDVATRVAQGDLEEGCRLYGRSVMASEYRVSPETIRRALRLLADMKVVDIKPQSGAVVLSRDNARRYIETFGGSADTRALRQQLQGILDEYEDLNHRLVKTASSLIQSRETFASAAEPLPHYEVAVPPGSPLIGKSIGALKFWQSTGGTIVAIRRRQSLILSPGPYAELYDGDVIILVGVPAAAEAARKFVAREPDGPEMPAQTEEPCGELPVEMKGAV